MNNRQLHIYEEETNLMWAPVVVVAAAAATYILSDVFLSDVSTLWGVSQIVALLLIVLCFYGILKLSDPLYHFIFRIEENTLFIHVRKGEQKVRTITLELHDIEALKFEPSEPRAAGEALFDYSVNYHLMWKSAHHHDYQRLIDLGPVSFVLKVDDIAKIIRFIRSHHSDIYVPADQASFFSL